jgi:hypothetical protein
VKILRNIGNFAFFLFLTWVVSATAFAAKRPHIQYYRSFEGPDRTITWRVWKEAPGGAFRWRTGDRYLGGLQWEHYLCFELLPGNAQAVELSMIHLASDSVEDAILRPGLRFAILKVTNHMMTAHKGVWEWTAREDTGTQRKTGLRDALEINEVASRR